MYRWCRVNTWAHWHAAMCQAGTPLVLPLRQSMEATGVVDGLRKMWSITRHVLSKCSCTSYIHVTTIFVTSVEMYCDSITPVYLVYISKYGRNAHL
jgi:hypothetical protein